MKRLLKYLKGYEKETILAPLFKMLEAFFDLLVPLVVADLINNGIAAGDKGYIISRVLIMGLLALIGLACSITAQYFAAKASVGFGTKVRQAAFDHMEHLDYRQMDILGAGTLVTRLTSDINQAQTGVNMGLRLLLRSPLIVFGAMIMAFTINVKAALIFLAAIPVLSLVVGVIMAVTIPLYRKVQAALDGVTTITRENLTGVRVIRAFHKEKDEVEEFDRQNDRLTSMNEFTGKISALMNPLTYVLINIATVILIYTGAVQVNLGTMEQGDVVALYNYMSQIIVELIKLASLIVTINKACASADRVADILDLKNEMTYPDEEVSSTESGTVEFRNVHFSYTKDADEALSNISFKAEQGMTIGIIGGTGAGKSSIINLIPRFYDADQGEVFVDGINVKDYPEKQLIHKIGIVPQKAMLFAGTIRDNLKWGNENADDETLWSALETAQAKEVVEGKEGGLDYVLEQNGRNLSGGQRQRLTIARALVKKPEILILDDSASALDFATDAKLRKAIRALKDYTTTFIISQRTSSIMQSDLILVLDDGEIAGAGTHEELTKTCSVYKEIYASQFPEEGDEK